MKRISFISLIMLFGITKGISQINQFGKVSDEHWNYKRCAFDSTANAVFLLDVGEVTFKKNLITKNTDPRCKLVNEFFLTNFERHSRIKVLSNSEKFEYSFTLRSVTLYSEKLRTFNGFIYTKENGEILKKKITQKQLEKVKNDDGSIECKLVLPDIKLGTIIEIYYMVESNIFTEFPVWDFSNEFPTLYSEINYLLPDLYEFNKECLIRDKLAAESHTQYDDFRVSVSYQRHELDYDLTVYTANSIKERYSLKNINSAKKLNSSYKLRYIVKFSKFGSIQSTSGQTMVKGEFSNN